MNDLSLPEEEAIVLVPQPPLFGDAPPALLQIPWNRGGPVALEDNAITLVSYGLYLPQRSTPGPLTAWSFREDGGRDACSNAVDWQP